jgi:hypothetical protein
MGSAVTAAISVAVSNSTGLRSFSHMRKRLPRYSQEVIAQKVARIQEKEEPEMTGMDLLQCQA